MWTRLIARIRRSRAINILFQLLLIILLIYAIGIWKTRDAARGEAPMIVGELLGGERITLEQFQGRPLLVHFWATWCPVCKFENDSIDAIAEDYPVLTIASWSGSKQEIEKYLQAEGLSYPVLADDDGEWAKLYGVKAVPSSFIIDKNGNIRSVEAGFTTEWGLRMRLWWYSGE